MSQTSCENMKVIDLFSGCGCFSYGFEEMGFKLIYALDKWDIACKSYKANFPQVDVDCRDAMEVKASEIPSCDILIGSPPCQDHSIANLHAAHDENLIKWFFQVADYLKPKFAIMEEVPLAIHYLPSNVEMKRIYRMCDYGIPQIRRRLFAGRFVEPAKAPTTVTFPAVVASERTRHSRVRILHLKGGRKSQQTMCLSDIFRRRCLIPEAKLVQTIPDDFVILGTLKEQYTQIGNAVPPLMSYRLAEAIAVPYHKLDSVEEKKNA